MSATAPGAERTRVESFGQLENGLRQASDWYLWGPYLSERQWGTVREDYSADGDAWSYFPHDHARSRAYRWGEDGMAGFSDVEQRLCLALALWNGRDPILKERMFGLTGAQANHGEDVKEYWWYLDAVPSHAWNRWRYHYPQRAFPYEDLIAENGRRGKLDAEYELLDTGAFDEDRYWIVEVDYAKADPTDLLMTVRVTNAGPEADTLHVLPTVWFRNTWSWDVDAPKPELQAGPTAPSPSTIPSSATSSCWPRPARTARRRPPLFCENETNDQRLYGVDIEDAVPEGRDQRPRRRRARHGQPRPARHQGGALVPARGRTGRHSRAAAPAAAGGIRAGRAPRRRSASTPKRSWRAAGRRPTSSTPSCARWPLRRTRPE